MYLCSAFTGVDFALYTSTNFSGSGLNGQKVGVGWSGQMQLARGHSHYNLLYPRATCTVLPCYTCGTCPLCLHKDVPCGFSTFFCVTMVMHVTACDVLVTRRWKYTIMRHLSYKFTAFAKTSIPIDSETSECGLKEAKRLSSDNGCWSGKQRIGSQCQTFCRRNSGALEAETVSQGYCLSIPCEGFLYSIPVWSYNMHRVYPSRSFQCSACNFMTG